MDAQTLGEAMGWSCSRERYEQLLPGYISACKAANITNMNRAAMFAAQLGHESVGLKYMEEIADGSAYEWRRDLGNVYAGDGRRFKGRGPIQLTGRNNYRAFTQWTRREGLSDIDFEAEPHRLSEPHWGFLAASYYWTVARPQINALADANNVDAVTRAINGGLNGRQDRINRYNRAHSLGDRILVREDSGKEIKAVEKVLDYPRTQIAQDTFYNCGPASTQTVVWAASGRFHTEADLGRELGTHTGGTDWIGQFPKVLNRHIADGKYVHVEMPNDPPSSDQKEQLWNNIVASINAEHGVVANIVAPPSNYPKAVSPSNINFEYRGGTVYHYIAVMGYRLEPSGARKVWIADSGFRPFGGWISFDQLATLIPPKGYAYSQAPAKDGAPSLEGEDVLTFKQFTDFIKGFFGPQIDALQEVWRQLRGPDGNGWAQLGQNEKGQNLTLVDAVAAIRQDIAALRSDIDAIREGKK